MLGITGSFLLHLFISSAFISGLVMVIWRYLLQHSFAKMLEKSKFNFTRLAANHSLYSTKQHDAYVQMWSSLLKAQGNIAYRLQLNVTPSFDDYNEEDIREFLSSNNVPRAAIEGACKLRRDQKALSVEQLERYWTMFNRRETKSVINQAQNDSLSLDLYFSDDVSTCIRNIVGKMKSCVAWLNGYGYDPSGSMDYTNKATQLSDEIHNQMNVLSKMMKREIRFGFYQEPSE